MSKDIGFCKKYAIEIKSVIIISIASFLGQICYAIYMLSTTRPNPNISVPVWGVIWDQLSGLLPSAMHFIVYVVAAKIIAKYWTHKYWPVIMLLVIFVVYLVDILFLDYLDLWTVYFWGEGR